MQCIKALLNFCRIDLPTPLSSPSPLFFAIKFVMVRCIRLPHSSRLSVIVTKLTQSIYSFPSTRSPTHVTNTTTVQRPGPQHPVSQASLLFIVNLKTNNHPQHKPIAPAAVPAQDALFLLSIGFFPQARVVSHLQGFNEASPRSPSRNGWWVFRIA